MPSRDGPAGNGHKHDRPDGTNFDRKTGVGRKGKIRMEYKDPNDPEEKPQEKEEKK